MNDLTDHDLRASRAARMLAAARPRLRVLARRAASLRRDEQGSAMVFGALTLLTLATATLMVVNVGLYSSERMQLQNAADAAAYSAALVEANSLNSIAAINDGMAYIHFNMQRYAIDVVVFGTFAAIENHHQLGRGGGGPLDLSEAAASGPLNAPAPFGGIGSDIGSRNQDNPAAPAGVVGIANATGRFRQAADIARREIPRGEMWMRRLALTERVIAMATPVLAERTAARIAAENGADSLSILPRADIFFDDSLGNNALIPDPESGGNQLSDAFARRFAAFDLGVPDGSVGNGPLRLPPWWDPNTGQVSVPNRIAGRNYHRMESTDDNFVANNGPFRVRARAGDPANPNEQMAYFQTRVCWNRKDLARHGRGSPHASQPVDFNSPLKFNAYERYDADGPNGHWHVEHTHYVLDPLTGFPIPIQHDAGHFEEAERIHQAALDSIGTAIPIPPVGPLDNDTHHGVMECPTCRAEDHDGDLKTDVRHTPADITRLARTVGVQGVGQNNDVNRLMRITLSDQVSGETFVAPLLIHPRAIREPIRVAAWRGPQPAMVNKIFVNPEGGMLAVASARVGVAAGIDPTTDPLGEPRPLPWAEDANDPEVAWSQLYSFLEPRTGFDARLTSSNGGSLGLPLTQWWQQLIYEPGGNLWRRGDGGADPRPLQTMARGATPSTRAVDAGRVQPLERFRGGIGAGPGLEQAVRH